MEKREKTVSFLRRAALAACLLAGVCSCKKDGGDGSSPAGGGVFTAVTESHAGDGKTTISNGHVEWKQNDEIKVYSSGEKDGNGNVSPYCQGLAFTAESAGTTSEFVAGSIPDGFIADGNNYAAIYPSTNTFAMGEGEVKTFTVEFPSEWDDAEWGFAGVKNPMVAFAEGSSMLAFKNVCGLLELHLKGVTPVKDIKIRTLGEKDICGTITFNYNGGDPKYVSAAGSGKETDGKEITVNVNDNYEGNGDCLDLDVARVFRIPLPAGTCESGFEVEVTDLWGGHWVRQAQGSNNAIERSKIKAMPEQRAITYVEIGGVKWATVNIGAHAPWEYGDYFAWGATETWYKTKPDGMESESVVTFAESDWESDKPGGYTWDNARFQTIPGGVYGSTRWKKYVPIGSGYWYEGDGNGGDDKMELDLEDDVARHLYGGAWRMPKAERSDDAWENYSGDFKELCEACGIDATNEGVLDDYDEVHKVKGMWFYSTDGDKKLFLPTGGRCNGNKRDLMGGSGYYWSRSLYSTIPCNAYGLGFTSNYVNPSDSYNRYYGFSVRPVL